MAVHTCIRKDCIAVDVGTRITHSPYGQEPWLADHKSGREIQMF